MSTVAAKFRIIVAVAGVTILITGCLRGPDLRTVEVIETVTPTLHDGELYFSTRHDGSCHPTDCPEAGTRKGWLIDCPALNAAADALEDDLLSHGFIPQDTGSADADEGYFTGTIEGVNLTASVAQTTDASESSQPTEEPYASDPAGLKGRCAVYVGISAAP